MSGPKGQQKKRYARIYVNRREQLIRMVVEDDKHINKAAKKLGIKYSTAKLIIKKFKETGTLFVKKKPIKDTIPKEAPSTPSLSEKEVEPSPQVKQEEAEQSPQPAQPQVSVVNWSGAQPGMWFWPQMPFYNYAPFTPYCL